MVDENKKIIKDYINFIVLILIVFLVVLALKKFLVDITLVDGSSMNPTLNHGDRLLVNKLNHSLEDINYKDVIIFKSPVEENKYYIKRVIAKSGDYVEIKNSRVYVNNKLLEENYTSTNGITEYVKASKWELERDEVFVLGDNRPRSNDSRKFGPISENSIIGIAFFKFYPFNKIGKL